MFETSRLFVLVVQHTLYGQLEGTKWFLVAINKTEIGPRVSSSARLDVQSKTLPGLSDDCQAGGLDEGERGVVLQLGQPNKTRYKKSHK